MIKYVSDLIDDGGSHNVLKRREMGNYVIDLGGGWELAKIRHKMARGKGGSAKR